MRTDTYTDTQTDRQTHTHTHTHTHIHQIIIYACVDVDWMTVWSMWNTRQASNRHTYSRKFVATHCLDVSLSLRRTFSTRPLTNTHDWPAASASEATALRRYTNQIIIIIIINNTPMELCKQYNTLPVPRLACLRAIAISRKVFIS